MSRLTQAVRGEECHLRILPGCDDATVVGAHIQRPGMGVTGGKDDDIFVVPACRVCHDIIDRRGHEWRGVPADMIEKCKLRALQDWWLRLRDKSLVQ